MQRYGILRQTGRVAALAVILGATVSAYTTFGKWPTTSVSVYVNPANADVSASAAEAAIQTAMDVWNTQGNSPFRFMYAGRVNDTSVGFDNRSVMLFRNTANPNNGSALASTYCWANASGLADCDIVFWDGAYQFFTGTNGCAGGAYVEDIAVHELGHALGLGHSDVNGAVMYPTYSWCSQAFRVLDSDDIAGLQALYGTSGASKNTAPLVSITSPASGTAVVEGTGISFIASATDKEDGNLTAKLSWHSSRDGWIGSGGSFTRTLSVGSHTITASVTDSGGLSDARQVSVTVSQPVSNTAPSLSITSPGDKTSLSEGTAVTFTGSASDEQDGNLTSGIIWTSSRDGALGVGSGFSRVLSAGDHVVAATVTDSGGLSAARQVTVTVTVAVASSAASTQPQLMAVGYKVKGEQKADLSWSGFSVSTVDVYRNGVRIARTANSGSLTDHINGRGNGTYEYSVCEAGTTTCSNRVVVSIK